MTSLCISCIGCGRFILSPTLYKIGRLSLRSCSGQNGKNSGPDPLNVIQSDLTKILARPSGNQRKLRGKEKVIEKGTPEYVFGSKMVEMAKAAAQEVSCGNEEAEKETLNNILEEMLAVHVESMQTVQEADKGATESGRDSEANKSRHRAEDLLRDLSGMKFNAMSQQTETEEMPESSSEPEKSEHSQPPATNLEGIEDLLDNVVSGVEKESFVLTRKDLASVSDSSTSAKLFSPQQKIPPRTKNEKIREQMRKGESNALPGWLKKLPLSEQTDSEKKANFQVFGKERVGFFANVDKFEESEKSFWDELVEDDKIRLTRKPPRNGFEEMIQWTQEGKMWKYPIDNEWGMGEELEIPFHEHVFLENELDTGFPADGPVRHFMELVVNGLSKNPFMSLRRKKEHIEWYRNYFESKSKEIERYVEREEAYVKKLTDIVRKPASQSPNMH